MKPEDLLTKFQYLSSVFQTFNKKQQKSFINDLTNDQTKYLIELCMNMYYKTFDLTSKDVKTLEKYKSKIKKISSPTIGFKKKKKIMRGGGVGLIATVLKTIGSLLIPYIVQKSMEASGDDEQKS